MQRHAPPPAPITAEQLRRAFLHIRRPGWPSTFAVSYTHLALASPVFCACLHGIARNLARAQQQHPQRRADLFDESTP